MKRRVFVGRLCIAAVSRLRAVGSRRPTELQLRAAEESRRGGGRPEAVSSALFRLPRAKWRGRAGRRTRSESGHQLGSPPRPGSGPFRLYQERRERDGDARVRPARRSNLGVGGFCPQSECAGDQRTGPGRRGRRRGDLLWQGRLLRMSHDSGQGRLSRPRSLEHRRNSQAERDSRGDSESQGRGHTRIPAGAGGSIEGRAAARRRQARIELVSASAGRAGKPASAARR